MSMFMRGRTWTAVASRCGLLGVLAACAGLFSASRALAVDNAIVEALIGDSVNPGEGDYADVVKAITRFNRRDIEGAKFNLDKAKKDHRLLPPSEFMLAQLWAMANQGAAARAELENCVKLHPEDPAAYLVFADQALNERRFTDAGLEFAYVKTLAAKFNENKKRLLNFQTRAENGLALVAEARENWDEAKSHLDAWLALDPKSAAAHARLARVLFKADTSDKKLDGAKAAYAEYKEARNDDPKSISPDIALAQLYEEAKNHEKAKQFIALAVGQDLPAPADAESRLATLIAAAHWALESSDQPTEARDYAEMALKTKPDSLEAKFLRGVAARLLKDNVTAEKYLQEVFMSSPSNFAASNQFAQVLAEQKDKDKRQRALDIAQINQKMFAGQKNQQEIEATATLGWVLFNMEKINEADQVVQAVLNTGNPSPDALYFKARILQEMGKSEDAKKVVDLALKYPKNFVHRPEALGMSNTLARSLGTDTTDEKDSSAASNSGGSQTAPKNDTGTGKETLGPTKATTSTGGGR